MQYNGATEVSGSWTKHNFDLSINDLDSLRIILNKAIEHLDGCDDHVTGFIRGFLDNYKTIFNAKAKDKISRDVIVELTRPIEDKLDKVKVIALD